MLVNLNDLQRCLGDLFVHTGAAGQQPAHLAVDIGCLALERAETALFHQPFVVQEGVTTEFFFDQDSLAAAGGPLGLHAADLVVQLLHAPLQLSLLALAHIPAAFIKLLLGVHHCSKVRISGARHERLREGIPSCRSTMQKRSSTNMRSAWRSAAICR
ncbi:hypothetical protein [Ensifer sp. LC163]|uniref:hypothetical protein n=1 Tax=Ensifer sp. LC163 TaxID=1120652 RepID=UPI001FCD6016|nr:hypothetical protein [Ensifer sp. LC163]